MILDTRFNLVIAHCDLAFPNHSRMSPNHPRLHQKFPKSCILDEFSLLGLAKQFFSIDPSKNLGQIPHPNEMGNLKTQIVEASSNPTTWLPLDSQNTTEFTSLKQTAIGRKDKLDFRIFSGTLTEKSANSLAKILNPKFC